MMVRIQGFVAALLAALILVAPASVMAAAGDASSAEIEQLRKDVEKLRRQLSESSTAMPRSNVDKMVEGKYGPNSSVTTRAGRLTIGGLLQVWYYTVQNDHRGNFNDPNGTGIFDTNEASDNDSFRIRRAELTFTMDIHENVQAVVRIDPAREAISFPNMPVNTANNWVFKTSNNVAPEYDAANGPGLGNTSVVGNVQTGAGRVPRLLKDAYINYHGVVPHHDFTVGEFRPQIGEEGPRGSDKLEFIERSMIGQLTEDRDLGIQAHGFWWDDRFQYWLGAFDGAGNYFSSRMNRSDDNDSKDFLGALMIRPVWKNECWGSLEFGYTFMWGRHGEGGNITTGGTDPINNPLNGLNRPTTSALRHAAWGSYHMGGPVRGWWIRGEWQYIKDRNAPGVVADLLGNGGTDIGNTGSGSGLAQANGTPFPIQGWYVSTGYKIQDCCFCDCSPSFLKGFEFAFRYEVLQNVMVADQFENWKTDLFSTRVYTAGINYYIKGHNAKIQANYNWVDDPSGSRLEKSYGMREVRNDSFMVNFQVAF
jgi:hypothetical protein